MPAECIPPPNEPHQPAPRKGYEKPVLIDYGDIRALTRAVGQNGAPDGGHVTGQMNSQP